MLEYCLFALDNAEASSAFTWLLLLFAVVLGWTVVVGWDAGAVGVTATSFLAASRIWAFCSGVNFIVESVCSNPEKLVVGVDTDAAATVVVVVVACVSIRSTRAFIASSWVPKSAKALDNGLKLVL